MLTQLRELGMTDNEAKVFLAMLELGPATVLQIATKAGINRPTTYVQIEALKKRGLVEHMTKGKKTLYAAKEPSQLEAMLERQAKEIEVHKSELAKVLPQLQTMYDLAGRKPVVRYFEGRDGIAQVRQLFLRAKPAEVVGILSLDAMEDLLGPATLKQHSQQRSLQRIPSRIIYTSSRGRTLAQDDPESLRKTKFIESRRLPFTLDIAVYGDVLVITSYRNPVSAVHITHPEIAQSFRGIFELLWGLIGS